MRRSVTLIGLLQAAAALTVSFSIVTAFDFLHRWIELFSHFRLQYLVVAALLAITFAALRSYAYMLALLLTSVFNAALVAPWYFEDTPQTGGIPVKILLANVHASNTSYERLIELVAEESPDIVFLQEVNNAWMAATRALASGYAFHYAQPREGNFGIAMFSRIPLDSVTHVDSPPRSHPTIVAEASVSGREFTVISTHPDIPIGKSGYLARNHQLEHVASLVADASGPTVLIGDLNTSIWSQSYKTLIAGTGLHDARRGFGVLPTWPTLMPFAMIPLDHALVSSGIGVVDIRPGRRIGSDHLPLVVVVHITSR